MEFSASDFALRKKGIYGILHVIILLLSLFLVISISIDTFKGIPFYTQSVYMKVQLWICVLFLFDFILELFLSKNKYAFHLFVGGDTLPEYYILYGMDFFTRSDLYDSFCSFGPGRLCDGYCGGVAYL